MKARIKATGEIIKIADYATIALDEHDSWGNPIEVKPEDIELIQEVSGDEHWQDVRERAAIAALNGILSNPNYRVGENSLYVAAQNSANFADALVKLLKGE